MDAYSTESDLSYSDMAPVFAAGSSESALALARSTAAAFGIRITGGVEMAGAATRLRQQGNASAVWVELDEFSAEHHLQELIAQLNSDVRDGRFGAVVSAPKELIDTLAAMLDDDVQLLIDADEAERASALALALAAKRNSALALSDVAADRNAERLRQLSDEVGRIASTLARLSTGPGGAIRPAESGPVEDVPEISADTVRAIVRARRLRDRFFSADLFADPAWDMLLDLLQAEISQLRTPVSSLCIAAAVPATTALRWLNSLVQRGLLIRRADPHDGRRIFVELAPAASSALRRYFAEVGKVAVI